MPPLDGGSHVPNNIMITVNAHSIAMKLPNYKNVPTIKPHSVKTIICLQKLENYYKMLLVEL